MGPIALLGTIHGSHYTISANFYLYLQYFQQNKRIPNTPLNPRDYGCVWILLILLKLKNYY